MKTIVKISKADRDIIEKQVRQIGYNVTFYTVEKNELLLQMEIEHLCASELWHLGMMCGHMITNSDVQRILK